MTSDHLWLTAGWTMLHFLWVGAAIALATLLARLLLRSVAPVVRYTVTLFGFAVLAGAPAVIAGFLWLQHPPRPSSNLAAAAYQPPAPVEPYRDAPTIDLAQTPITGAPSPAVVQSPYVVQWSPPTTGVIATPRRATMDQRLERLFEQVAGWLPLVWLVGAPATFLLLASGLVGVGRLRRDCTLITDGPLHAALTEAARRLRIGGRTALALSERVTQPVLVGVWRPLVLLPASAASGYSPEQLEMVLLHELAHVRRRDNLVNLLQRIIESLLFFHPAVWLVSRWLRADREQCCDALVVRLTEDPQSYAELLVAVAEQSGSGPLPLAASAMASHPLARRVRRILKLEDEPMLVSKRLLLMLMVAGLGLTGACGYSFSQVTNEPNAGNATASPPTPADNPRPTQQPMQAELAPGSAPAVSAGRYVGASAPRADKPAPSRNPHFLSLDEQRVADLAFRMFDIEVAPLDEYQLAAAKEEGFDGGVIVTKGTYGKLRTLRNTGGPVHGMLIQHGDILVGLHAWPTEGIDGLAEVLRRGDLAEFNPLKFYVLRPTPSFGWQSNEAYPPQAANPYPVDWPSQAGASTAAIAPSPAQGRIVGSTDQFPPHQYNSNPSYGAPANMPQNFGGQFGATSSPPKLKYQVVTGRIKFDADAWKAEQERLRSKQLTSVAPMVDGEAEKGTLRYVPTPDNRQNQEQGASYFMAPQLGADPGPAQPSAPAPRRSTQSAAPSRPQSAPAMDRGFSRNFPPQASTRADGLTEGQLVTGLGATDRVSAVGKVKPDDKSPQPQQQRETPPLTKLTYNGRSFEEWNTQWRTELSEEERSEAVKALGAFGRAGHVEAATNAILEIVPAAPRTKVMMDAYKAAFASQNGMDARDWRPIVFKRCVANPEEYSKWVGALINTVELRDQAGLAELQKLYESVEDQGLRMSVLRAMHRNDYFLLAPASLEIYRTALRSKSEEPVRVALSFVRQAVEAGRENNIAGPIDNFAPMVRSLLLHPEDSVRRHARLVVHEIPESQTAADLVGPVLEAIDAPGSTTLFDADPSLLPAESDQDAHAARLALIRTLATVGPLASEAVPRLEQLLESEDRELAWAAAVAIDSIDNARTDGSSFSSYQQVIATDGLLTPSAGVDTASWLNGNKDRLRIRLMERIKAECSRVGIRYGNAHESIWGSWWHLETTQR